MPALGQEFKAGDLVVEHPWLRMPPPGATVAAGFMRIVNRGAEPDRLLSVSSDIAAAVQLHSMTIED
ncbi:MAG: copper chaperone PCu(A)C, partial [Dongiaceae bacterium]